MKRVRYALGAVGLAPAVGMLAAAPSAAAAGHAPARSAKTVSLQHLRRPDAPDTTCGSPSVTPAHRSTHGLRLQVGHSGSCIHHVQGEIATGHTGLEMRTQVYSYDGGARVFQNFVKGSINLLDSATTFVTNPNVYGSEVCIALVESTHHSKIVDDWGPNCRTSI